MVVGSITMYNPQLLYPDFFFENMYTNSLVSYWVKIRMRDWLSVFGGHMSCFGIEKGYFLLKIGIKFQQKLENFALLFLNFSNP